MDGRGVAATMESFLVQRGALAQRIQPDFGRWRSRSQQESWWLISNGLLVNRDVGLPRFRLNFGWPGRLPARFFHDLKPGLGRIQLFSNPRFLVAIQKSRRSEPAPDFRQLNDTAKDAGSNPAQVSGLTPAVL